MISRSRKPGALLLLLLVSVCHSFAAQAQGLPADQLKAQILQTWHIQIADQDLTAEIVPMVPPADRPVTMNDISAANETACLTSVVSALSVYPASLVSGLISRIAIADQIYAGSIRIGGFQVPGLLALNCDQANAAASFDEDSIHNELAGLLLSKYSPDLSAWQTLNDAGFKYGDINSVKAELRDPQGRAGDEALYRNGFVSRLGLTDVTNDFDTFAGQIFGHPAETVELLKLHPALRGKTRLLMTIYLGVAPGLRAMFDQSGLTAAANYGAG
jgi:hypothetical protein